MKSVNDRKALLCAALVFVVVLLVYGIWLSHAYVGDDLQYARVIEQATTGEVFYHPAGYVLYDPQAGGAQVPSQSSDLPKTGGAQAVFLTSDSDVPVNPRYLLEWPSSIMVVTLWKALGWRGNVIEPILVFRILVGALGVLFFFLAIYALWNDALIAGIVSIGLGTSHAYWLYSTHLDYTINMTALICLAFYLLVLRYRGVYSGGSNHLALIVVLAIATFFSWIAGITTFIFALAAAYWHLRRSIGSKFKAFVRFCAIYGVLVVAVIAIVIAVWVSPASLFSLDYWGSAAYAGHLEYDINIFGDILRAVVTFARAQIVYPGPPKSFRGFHGLITIFMSIPCLILVLRRRQLQRKTRVWAVLFVAWLISYGVFSWAVNPGHSKYSTVPLIAWWALVALTLEHLKLSRINWYRSAIVAASLFIALTFSLNLTVKFLPQSNEGSNAWLSIAESLKQSEPNALFVSPRYPLPAGHPLGFYIVYFARRNVVSAGHVNYYNAGDEQIVRQVVSTNIERHRSAGGKVYAFGFESLTPDQRREFLGLLDGQHLEIAWSFPQLVIYEVVPVLGKLQ